MTTTMTAKTLNKTTKKATKAPVDTAPVEKSSDSPLGKPLLSGLEAYLDHGLFQTRFTRIEKHPNNRDPKTREFLPFTAQDAAEGIRVIVEDLIPKTWDDYRERRSISVQEQLSAFWVMSAVRQQSTCTYDEAHAATVAVFPELFADYWQAKTHELEDANKR